MYLPRRESESEGKPQGAQGLSSGGQGVRGCRPPRRLRPSPGAAPAALLLRSSSSCSSLGLSRPAGPSCAGRRPALRLSPSAAACPAAAAPASRAEQAGAAALPTPVRCSTAPLLCRQGSAAVAVLCCQAQAPPLNAAPSSAAAGHPSSLVRLDCPGCQPTRTPARTPARLLPHAPHSVCPLCAPPLKSSRPGLTGCRPPC